MLNENFTENLAHYDAKKKAKDLEDRLYELVKLETGVSVEKQSLKEELEKLKAEANAIAEDESLSNEEKGRKIIAIHNAMVTLRERIEYELERMAKSHHEDIKETMQKLSEEMSQIKDIEDDLLRIGPKKPLN